MFCWPKPTLVEEGKMYGKIFNMVESGKLDFDEFQEHVSNHQEYSNKRYMFWTQALLSGSLVAFSGTMLAVHGIDAAYMSLISGILGYWLPTPLSQTGGFTKPKVVSKEIQEQRKKVASLIKENEKLKSKIQPANDLEQGLLEDA
ncbi:hypothetical protein PBCVCVM1_891R [Paramecium bursaria Chlorella virus CVM-1]|uniref:Uncharacterized protein n=1 Tax=Paramecium bursaria Chlorella virus CVA-1 TaxID=42683 RepID=M1HFS1_9PHYC|nr:hypothetical protein F8205_gp168 [Paramecium bursaria Chlorella virus CVA-1]AGE48972.1 hypothetical protein PBCVAP110A_891R [Paramecium bursaria Chlorella virus AP110A]AGE50657.1 hypothetical protein PBCVCVA1_898R [Paramecium bursaria Chlorella virus CVA-1]AGE51996.1 hypothetical protein PBCVCVM1_891R [Paramecium bursaria Chlorella virus CVM-1]AGE52335.1 hypothetical protein PBCVCVR1_904R [Paramecium bursaria Chlorella virus CVR-1]